MRQPEDQDQPTAADALIDGANPARFACDRLVAV